jgi:hypothetical protein
MANRARNNIQESLRDLGPDTLYRDGQPISPAVEDGQATTQVAGCQSLVNWKFQLGTGYTGKKPETDQLSTVTGAYPEINTTQASVPELSPSGDPTGRSVAGAQTFTLTPAQAALAQTGNKLWIQGGTKTDPLLNRGNPPFDPPQAFGALRCSVDNLNGDNVEWISYPKGTTHVFCYYFAVSPAPDAATIVVKKTLLGVSGSRQFLFRGNVSYNPGPDPNNPNLNPFTVNSGSSVSFIRAAGASDWNFFEEPDDSYPLQDVVCSSSDPAAVIVNPRSGTNQANPVRITFLPPESTVTCEFINAEEPPPAKARIAVDKVTANGVGTFRIRADHPEAPAKRAAVTTIEPRVPERAVELEAPGGDFTIRETLPPGVDPSAWRMTRLSCDNGYVNTKTKIGNTYTIPVEAGDQVTCEVLNTPQGRINIRKITKGGFGTFYFGIIPEGEFEIPGVGGGVAMSATTDSSGDTATAKPIPGHGSNGALPFQDYAVVEFAKTSPIGTWTLDKVECTNVKEKPIRVGSVLGAEFRLTPQEPEVTCTFTNSFKADLGESRWATLDLSKVVSGPAGSRASDVVLSVSCDDGQAKELRLPADQGPSTSWAEPMVFPKFPGGEVDCTIVETATGAASGFEADTKMIVDRGEDRSTSIGPRTTVRLKPKSRVAVEVRNAYSVPTVCTGSDC